MSSLLLGEHVPVLLLVSTQIYCDRLPVKLWACGLKFQLVLACLSSIPFPVRITKCHTHGFATGVFLPLA